MTALGCNVERDLPETGAVLAELEANAAERLDAPRNPAPWQTTTPEAQGIDSDKLADALLAIREQNIHVHSLLLARNGKAVTNSYFYPYDGTTVHDLASVTKSVMTTLIGIAIDQGKLSLDDTMLSFFSDREIKNRSALKEKITVAHLASMTSGLACEKEPSEPTLAEMKASEDWVQFFLDRPAVREPGTYFMYCSPGTHMLSAILQQATGMSALEFGRRYLFAPLGIREVIWPVDPQGYNTGWGELRIHPLDTAKLGYLWMNHGLWHGRRIVSREWIEASTRPLIETREGSFYGYGFWVELDEPQSYRADGRGGQYVLVIPSINLMLATSGGGFTLDQLAPLLVPVFPGQADTLPRNRAGVAKLRSASMAVAQPPAPVPVAPLPDMANVISGQTFELESNPTGLERFELTFPGGAEGILHYRESGGEVTMPIGLDGVYRLAPGDYGLLEGARGQWSDDETFVLEYDEIANQGHLLMRIRFEAERAHVEITDVTAGSVGQFEAIRVNN